LLEWEALHPDGTKRVPVGGEEKYRRPVAIVRRDRCDADWIGRCGNPRRSLEDRSCLKRMPTKSAARGVRMSTDWSGGESKIVCRTHRIDGVNKVPKAGAFGLRQHRHLCCAAPDMAAVRAFRCSSNCTRPVSWLEPAWCGTHPRTKGTRCFTGGYRHRIPSTPKGLLTSRVGKT
jgi:hypothetical protein